ncbi:MAG TPA: DinB family protein [Gemmatimonadales bacterium]|nr:DinB family protein [Gemmatimonadales bacterium]
MDGRYVAGLFGYNLMVLEKNTAGITHEMSLRTPPAGGNCINWIVGHILFYRNAVHAMLGLPPAWPGARQEQYGTGATLTGDAEPFGQLLAMYQRSQERVVPAIAALDAAGLARRMEAMGPLGPGSLGDRLVFFGFHEAYHFGQIGILRHAVGLTGAIG